MSTSKLSFSSPSRCVDDSASSNDSRVGVFSRSMSYSLVVMSQGSVLTGVCRLALISSTFGSRWSPPRQRLVSILVILLKCSFNDRLSRILLSCWFLKKSLERYYDCHHYVLSISVPVLQSHVAVNVVVSLFLVTTSSLSQIHQMFQHSCGCCFVLCCMFNLV